MTAPVAMVRARHGAVRIEYLREPYDTVHYRLYHPALWTGADVERQTGNLPPDTERAPWPVIIFLGGINIGPESYRWLATELAADGYAVMVAAMVGETLPGVVGLTPGIDLEAVTPDTYGTRPSGITLEPLRTELVRLNRSGPFAGLLALDRIGFGGHSGGGSVVLQNAQPEWYRGLRAVFTYASHLMTSTMLGFAPATVLSLPAAVPALIMAGELDGVMTASAERYSVSDTRAHDPVTETFERGVSGDGSALIVMAGATHTAVMYPRDDTTARGFLDPPPQTDPALTRDVCRRAISAFCDLHLRDDPGGWDRLVAICDSERSEGVARSAVRLPASSTKW